MSLSPGQVLLHYRLVSRIGAGGMGVVWKADDLVLNRAVAVKVLPSDVGMDRARREAFLREARVASAASDTHIAHVYDLGEDRGLDFIVMEYVEGDSLEAILRGKRLPLDRVVEIGRQVARGLSRAHRKRLLHRDLKPSNIMVTRDGDVKIIDFGLAILLAEEDVGIGTEDTTRAEEEHGARLVRRTASARRPVAGTIPFMSPEQVRGEELDARSDVFSLGTVLYRMTTGQLPFRGRSNPEVLDGILQGRPVPPRELAPKIPLELDRIIRKALAPRRSERYQTMEDLAVDLRRLGRELEAGSSPSYDDVSHGAVGLLGARRRVAIVLGLSLVALTALVVGVWQATRGDPPNDRRVLVLAWEITGQQDGADFAARAFSQTFANTLAFSEGLEVLPVHRRADLDSSSISEMAPTARRLGAGRLVTGILERETGAIRATLQIFDTVRNRLLPVSPGDTEGSDLSGVASLLAREAATRLGASSRQVYDYVLNLTGEPPMSNAPEVAVVLGALRRERANDAWEAAVSLSASYPAAPEAAVLLTFAALQVWDAQPTELTRGRLETSILSLERTDAGNPYGRLFRAYVDRKTGDPRGAVDAYSAVLERTDLTPAARAWVLRLRAQVHVDLGAADAALSDLEEAGNLDPAHWATFAALSTVLRGAGRFEEAVERARQAASLEPGAWKIQQSLGLALSYSGKVEASIGPYERACETSRTREACALLALSLHQCGRRVAALERARLAEHLPESVDGCYNLACFWAQAGDPGSALTQLHRAVDLGYAGPEIDLDPSFDALRSDPEFQAIHARIVARTGHSR